MAQFLFQFFKSFSSGKDLGGFPTFISGVIQPREAPKAFLSITPPIPAKTSFGVCYFEAQVLENKIVCVLARKYLEFSVGCPTANVTVGNLPKSLSRENCFKS